VPTPATAAAAPVSSDMAVLRVVSVASGFSVIGQEMGFGI